MRVVRLCLLFLLAYVVSVVFLFPVSPVVDYIKPQLGPVALAGVSGKLYNGNIASVKYDDGLLPLEFSDVGWTLAPKTLLKGGAGATVRYLGYGGGGEGDALRLWNGDFAVLDFDFTAEAKELESLLPVPLAQFSGAIEGKFSSVKLEKQLLTELVGTLSWSDALLEAPVQTSLGNVDITIERDSDTSHIATVKANGGDVVVDGTLNLSLNGDFTANVVLTPSAQASPDIINGLRQFARPEAGGNFRFQQTGNINKLM